MRSSSKLGKQKFKHLQGIFMARSVGRENAVAVLKVGTVVPHIKAKEVGESSSSFFENDLRSTCVPEFGTGTGVYIDVAGPVRDKADL